MSTARQMRSGSRALVAPAIPSARNRQSRGSLLPALQFSVVPSREKVAPEVTEHANQHLTAAPCPKSRERLYFTAMVSEAAWSSQTN